MKPDMVVPRRREINTRTMKNITLTLLLTTSIVTAQFNKYLKSFNKATGLELETTIVFGDFKDYGWESKATAIAVPSRALIVVNRQKWVQASSSSKWAVMYHELGHIIGYRHNDEPGSLMFYKQRSDITQAQYNEKKAKFLKEYHNSKLH